MALTLEINGESRTVEALTAPTTLDRVVEELGLQTGRVAIELNGEIAPRMTWHERHVTEGDKLEVVHFVGGGSRN